MKQKLKQNLDLKVLAVLFSIIIWIIVVNIDDPIKSVEFNDVPIKFINAEALQEKNLVFMVENDLDCVDVTVSGRRSVIEELSKENIDVVADLKTLNELNSVPLVFSVNKYGNEIDGIKAMLNEHVFLLRTGDVNLQKYLYEFFVSTIGQELLKNNGVYSSIYHSQVANINSLKNS